MQFNIELDLDLHLVVSIVIDSQQPLFLYWLCLRFKFLLVLPWHFTNKDYNYCFSWSISLLICMLKSKLSLIWTWTMHYSSSEGINLDPIGESTQMSITIIVPEVFKFIVLHLTHGNNSKPLWGIFSILKRFCKNLKDLNIWPVFWYIAQQQIYMTEIDVVIF